MYIDIDIGCLFILFRCDLTFSSTYITQIFITAVKSPVIIMIKPNDYICSHKTDDH